ncbi:adenosylcobyric acid synthase (glutamine-hydrolysing) [Parasphingorhabdus marina DSM 22363]|uniref:Cobyric acid synthase n=1 Tax=Parasphingorhabdus marina DSM 22363 TaxID=1123272 RepID=A0A1N6D0Y7_9SPHN|nr:cobyric acid synthase [Parasphingorhabdus marina]SIN64384.1 adenosylcobyric acid synthase (glutamine-hydrolysing) [Parasphingorhabdus marina DSM 22363]
MAAVMLQGTGSDVGKSVLVAGLCRLLANRGMAVRPFKPQNMSNNAAVTPGGGEIGRAQALQALACRVSPHVDMNPVLLKPQSDKSAQVIVHGQVQDTGDAGYFRERKSSLHKAVLASYKRLSEEADIVLVEGAGSPAEINLRAGDIANMGFARSAGVPVVLIGDIDRGGVIASIVGTKAVLDGEDAAMIRGFLINKFRGDIDLFTDGYKAIADRTGWAGLGVIPWLPIVRNLPAEDAVVLEQAETAADGLIEIAVPMFSRIANFDDFDPLRLEPNVRLHMVPPGAPIPASAALIIIPGTKATIADLKFLRTQGWDIDIAAHVRRGGHVLGICGGYQMLGQTIADPDGVEGPAETVAGLQLLPIDTVLAQSKTLSRITGKSIADDQPFGGYEIHAGQTKVQDGITDCATLLRTDGGREEGVISPDGRISGCYVHGLFDDPAQRQTWLARLGVASNGQKHESVVDNALDDLAEALEKHVDIERLLAIAGEAK